VSAGGTGGEAIVGQACAAPNGSCSLEANLAIDESEFGAGAHEVKVIVTDNAGNQSRRFFNPGDDWLPPETAISGSLVEDDVVGGHTGLTTHAEDAGSGVSGMSIYLDDRLLERFVNPCLTGACSLDHTSDIDLSQGSAGTHRLTVVVEDALGNKTREKRSIVLDPIPPVVTVSGPLLTAADVVMPATSTGYLDADIQADDNQSLEGSGVATISVWLDGQQVQNHLEACPAMCPLSATTPYRYYRRAIPAVATGFPPPPQTLKFVATDHAGNVGTKVIHVDVQPLNLALSGDLPERSDYAPAAEDNEQADGAPVYDDEAPTMTLRGFGSARGVQTLTVAVDGVPHSTWSQSCGEAAYCPMTRTFTFYPGDVTTGNHLVTATATDFENHETSQSFHIAVEQVDQAAQDAASELEDDPSDPESRSGGPPGAPAGDYLSCTDADEAPNFDLATPGTDAAGYNGSHIIRRCDPPEDSPSQALTRSRSVGADPESEDSDVRANYVSYWYGSCDLADSSGSDEGCAAPIEVQVWPACERSLDSYKLPGDEVYPRTERPPINGVPTFLFDQGTRLEMYSGDATIVIFGDDPDRVVEAAHELKLAPAGTVPGEAPAESSEALPPPATGALSGEAVCS
jgi:hypothetical protein